MLAAPFHLQGAKDAAPYGYGRDGNPTWSAVERAIGELDGGETVLFGAGMAAVCAVLEPALGPGDVLVVVEDGYSGVRGVARDRLAPRGVEVRFVPTDSEAIARSTAVQVGFPSRP